MSKATVEANFRKQAGNFLYVYIPELSIKAFPRVIQQKRDGQLKYIRAYAATTVGVTEDDVYGWIEDELRTVYKIPSNEKYAGTYILDQLAKGKPVQGKNYKTGITGINGPEVTGITVDGNRYSFDSETGLFYNETRGYQLQTSPIYTNEVLSNGFAQDTKAGTALTVNYNAQTGKFTPSGTGDSSGNLSWAQNTMNICQNIQAILPQIVNLVKSLAVEFSGVNPQQVAVNQVADGWVTPVDISSNYSASLSPWILAGLLLGGVVLSAKDKKGFFR